MFLLYSDLGWTELPVPGVSPAPLTLEGARAPGPQHQQADHSQLPPGHAHPASAMIHM